MNERRMQFAVGALVLAGVLITAILMMVNSPVPSGLNPFGRGKYHVTVELPEAPGVGPDTPVRKNGLLIGRVGSIEDVDDGVSLRLNIDKDRTLTTDHVPHVRTSVLGDATIDFVTTPRGAERKQLAEGDVIKGIVDPNPFDAISKLANLQDDIQQTMTALGRAGNEVADLAKRIDDAFGQGTEQGRVKKFMDTTELAMKQFAETMHSINQIIGDEPPAGGQLPNGQQTAGLQTPSGQELRSRLRRGMNELPDAVHEARVTLQDFRVVLDSANKNFRNLENFTEPLGRNGQQIAQSIVDAVRGLDKLVGEFTSLTTALNNREGTIGQLIHNPELYNNLNTLTRNAGTVVSYIYDLAKGLRPVVDNVRVFTDKIAREPGRLIKGAVGESSVVK